MHRAVPAVLVVAFVLVFTCGTAYAQEGQIAGTIRDASGGVLPGVLVEVSSPALISKTRSATSDDNGQYRITNLPVGTYSVTFALDGFSRQQRDNVVLTTGFTAPVNATMTVGQRSETVNVVGEAPVIDVQNARQVAAFDGEQIRELPTTRNIRSILTLTPGLTATGLGADCVGGVGVWCNNNIYNLSAHTATNDTEGGDAGPRHGRRDDHQHRRRCRDHGHDRRLCRRRRQCPGSRRADLRCARRLGDRRRVDQHRSPHRRQSIRRQLLRDVYAWAARRGGCQSSRMVRHEQRQPSRDRQQLSAHQRLRHIGAFGGPIKRDRLWFFSVARAWQKNAWSRQSDRIWDNANVGIWGQNYQPIGRRRR